MPCLTTRVRPGALAAIIMCTSTSGFVFAQDMPGPGSPVIPPAAPAPAAPASQPPKANDQPAPAQPASQKLNEAQLDQLIAPIAAYPDAILSQVLMAATYPLEVVEAARWVREPANESLTGDALAEALKDQNWDPSVMALVSYPRVLAMMADHVRWTEQLGSAFLAQQADVMAEVQKLRHEALVAGKLKVTPQVTVPTRAAPKPARHYAYWPTYRYAYHYSPYYYGRAPHYYGPALYYYGPAPYHGDGY